MKIDARVAVSEMPLRARVALALAVLFARDSIVLPLIADYVPRTLRRRLARRLEPRQG